MDRAEATSRSSATMRVLTRDGAEGVADAASAAGGTVLVHFDRGDSVVLPADLLQRQGDDSYRIPLTRGEVSAAAAAASAAAAAAAGNAEGGQEAVVPVVEEQLRVGKREVETGRVVVHITPHVHEEKIDLPLVEEHVDVERVQVNEIVQGPLAVRQEGDVTVVPVVEEVLVVEKRLMLREEIRLTRRRESRRHVESVPLRREEARVLRSEKPST